MKKFMKIMIGMVISTVLPVAALSQNSKIDWYSLNMGYGELRTNNATVEAVVGQIFLGTTRQVNTQIISGFLADTLLLGPVNTVNSQEPLPQTYSLMQNHPNPFNPSTIIEFHQPTSGHVTLKVFDVLGREVATLINAFQEGGYKTVVWDASNVPSGVYFYRVEAISISDPTYTFTQVKKMVLMK